MALSEIEKYIRKNQKDVDYWLTVLMGKYALRLLEGQKNPVIMSTEIVHDARREGKFIEVLEHLGIAKMAEYKSTSYSRYATQKSWYNIHIDHDVFEKMAPNYAKKRHCNLDLDKKKVKDRISGYPTLDSIEKEGLIYIYLNQSEYSIYETEEVLPSGNLLKPPVKVIIHRVYPKHLEGDAEREVFRKKLHKYYDIHVDKAIELLYGYMPKVLSNLPEKHYWNDDEITLKNMAVTRINTLSLNDLSSLSLKEMLPRAVTLQEYANALVEDLTTLIPLVEESKGKNISDVLDKGEVDLFNNAPLLMTSGDSLERELAILILKGSNRGLI